MGTKINRCLSLNVQLNLQELQFAVLIPKKGVEGEGCLSWSISAREISEEVGREIT